MKLIFWIALSFLPGLMGRTFRPGDWYASLPKAPWTPPNLAFPVVWTILYLLIGVAAWRAFKDGATNRPGALALFLIQWTLNALWSWIFFGRHDIGWGLADLAALWIAALATLIAFWRISPLAGGLLVPYQLWLTVAVTLNGYIWLKA